MDLKPIVNPSHTAIVVVDVQNDFCHSEGAQARQGMNVAAAQQMVNTLLEFLDRARQVKVPMIFVRNAQNAWTRSEAQLAKRGDRPAICEENTWGVGFYRVAPREEEYVVTKHRYSAFIGTDLDLVLKCRKIKTLALTGVTTNTCVESTARDGFMLEYNIVLVSDCAATHSQEEHQAALDNIRNRFGYTLTSNELLALWKS